MYDSMVAFTEATIKAAVMGTKLPTAAQAAYAAQSDQAQALADLYKSGYVFNKGPAKHDRTGQVGMKKAAAGADFTTNGPELLLVGDNPSGVEHVKVTPGDRGASGDTFVFNLKVGQVVGTDERAARQLWSRLKPIVMSEIRMKGAMSRG